jgi:hypothetical protein
MLTKSKLAKTPRKTIFLVFFLGLTAAVRRRKIRRAGVSSKVPFSHQPLKTYHFQKGVYSFPL